MYGIFSYIWLIFMVHVGKYTSPMDGKGVCSVQEKTSDVMYWEIPQKTHSLPLKKWWLEVWKIPFLLGFGPFSGTLAVSFKEGTG